MDGHSNCDIYGYCDRGVTYRMVMSMDGQGCMVMIARGVAQDQMVGHLHSSLWKTVAPCTCTTMAYICYTCR